MRLQLNPEYVFLAAFIAAFLATGMSAFDGTLNHSMPTGYFASDSFFHQAESTYLKEQGIIKYALPSMEGGRKDVYDSHPPFVFEAAGVISYAAGLEVYDAIYLFVILMLLLLGLTVYVIIRRFNRNVAMLSVPLTLLVYTPPFSQVINFGQWLFIAGALFMVAALWTVSRLEEKHSFILLSIFLAATALAHQPELLFAGIFLGIFVVVKLVRKHYGLKNLIPIAIAGLIAVVLSAYSLNIFRLTWLMTYFEDAKLGLTTGSGVFEKGFSDISMIGSILGISEAGINIRALIIGLFIVAGFLITLLMIFTKKKYDLWPSWIAFFILFISYLTFLGLAKRSFSHRWLWHFYFAFFFGLALYYALKAVIKNWNVALSAGVGIAMVILLALPSFGMTKGSLMDQNNWEAMKWASVNLPEDAHVYVFDAGRMQQSSALYNMRRVSFIIHRNAYERAFGAQKPGVSSLEEIQIIPTYEFGLASAYSHLLCDKGAFDYGYYHSYLPSMDAECHDDFQEPKTPERETKLCSMEYLYVNTAENGNYAFYNQALVLQLLKNKWIAKAYSNPGIIILKNSRPGDDCLGK